MSPRRRWQFETRVVNRPIARIELAVKYTISKMEPLSSDRCMNRSIVHRAMPIAYTPMDVSDSAFQMGWQIHVHIVQAYRTPAGIYVAALTSFM